MRKFRIKQVSEDEFIPQTKTKYQLFWRTIWWLDCETLTLFRGSSVFTLDMAKQVIERFNDKEIVKKEFPKLYKYDNVRKTG
jgi:hypothetical protein